MRLRIDICTCCRRCCNLFSFPSPSWRELQSFTTHYTTIINHGIGHPNRFGAAPPRVRREESGTEKRTEKRTRSTARIWTNPATRVVSCRGPFLLDIYRGTASLQATSNHQSSPRGTSPQCYSKPTYHPFYTRFKPHQFNQLSLTIPLGGR